MWTPGAAPSAATSGRWSAPPARGGCWSPGPAPGPTPRPSGTRSPPCGATAPRCSCPGRAPRVPTSSPSHLPQQRPLLRCPTISETCPPGEGVVWARPPRSTRLMRGTLCDVSKRTEPLGVPGTSSQEKIVVTVFGGRTSPRAGLTIYPGNQDPLGFVLNRADSRKPIRFAVGEPGRRSTVWRVWANKNKSDVYVASRRSAGIVKVSLHETGDWRMQWVSAKPDYGTASYSSYSGDYDGSGRVLEQWRRPAAHIPGWTDAMSIWVPGADVSEMPGDDEPGDGTQWVSNPGQDRVVEFRLKLVQPRKHALNLTTAMVDEHSVVSFINGFRLVSGEVLLVFAVDGPLDGPRREKVNRIRARERRNVSAYFDLSPASGLKAAVIDVDSDGYRSIWDLSLARS